MSKLYSMLKDLVYIKQSRKLVSKGDRHSALIQAYIQGVLSYSACLCLSKFSSILSTFEVKISIS